MKIEGENKSESFRSLPFLMIEHYDKNEIDELNARDEYESNWF